MTSEHLLLGERQTLVLPRLLASPLVGSQPHFGVIFLVSWKSAGLSSLGGSLDPCGDHMEWGTMEIRGGDMR